MKNNNDKPVLIGHRGEPVSFPENSLEGFRLALSSGACYVETDVQITADGIPVLSHDPSLLRLTGKDLVISDSTLHLVQSLPAGFPDRFGGKFQHFRIATLEQFCSLVSRWPKAKAFIEIKRAAYNNLGTKAVDIVLQTIKPIASQCIIISFAHEAVKYARTKSDLPIGWILPEWSNANHLLAEQLKPEYLFCNRKRLPPETQELWLGEWLWAVYAVNVPDEITGFFRRGISLIETNRVSELLSIPELSASCGE
ncbi:MAG: hypothetical protein EP297_05635 [Gammaproteobacteria bacterium]|nr:MAG: hypothetical protein EP297_05635 [Gammaproteobacteria bacterium]